MAASLEVIVAAGADVLVLQDMDYDAGGAALGALANALAVEGIEYPYSIALRPNSGWPTGVDVDGDGDANGPRDAHGYGRFNGEGGMAMLSRFPLAEVQDFSGLIWADLPESTAPSVTPDVALPVLRLHSVGAWDVQILAPNGPLHILTSHASAPVFDGPEDRNGLRNADEIRFWTLYFDGWSHDFTAFEGQDFVLAGTLNVDPERGEGRRAALLELLNHSRLQDTGPNTPTVDWEDPTPGDLRVDYILPDAQQRVLETGIIWPVEGPLAEAALEASDHRLIWVDIDH